MTSGFETFIYTDCVPGQGLGGSAGLQFQARSVGANPADQPVVQRHLLYEPPSVWMREGRAVEEYPPSFAHVHDGAYATASGRYLGKEANGQREGNQLTHAIATRDPASYSLPLRPAQLYQAPFWTLHPAPDRTSAAVPAGFIPGPYGVRESSEFVSGQRNGVAMLGTLIAALRATWSPSRTRVLFICEDADLVMRWIIAGTLLVPHSRALDIGFKVFSTDPSRSAHQVVAVHPAWHATTARVGNDLGYVVFDLVRGEHSSIDVPDEVAAWAKLFCDGDPWDVMDAIEVAEASGVAAQPDAAALGRAAVLGEDLTEHTAGMIAGWLRDTSPTLLAGYRGALVDRLVDPAGEWSHDVVRTLDELAGTGQVPADRAAAIRVALIRADLRQAATTGAATTGAATTVSVPRLGDSAWLPEHQRAAEDAVVEVARDCSVGGFEAVLRVARRFGLAVRFGELGAAVDRLVAHWAARPRSGFDINAWSGGAQLEDRLVDALNPRVPRELSAFVEFGRTWLPVLGHRLDAGAFDGPAHEAVLAAAVADSQPSRRAWLVDAVLARVRTMPPGDQRAGQLVSTLWRAVEPTAHELSRMADALPRDVSIDPRICDSLLARLTSAPSGFAVSAARKLIDGHNIRPPKAMIEFVERDRALERALAEIRDARTKPTLERAIDDLCRQPVELVGLRRAAVATTLNQVLSVKQVLRVLGTYEFLWQAYLESATQALAQRAEPKRAACVFCLATVSATPKKVRKNLLSAVAQWLDAATDEEVATATGVIDLTGDAYVKAWHELVKDVRGSGFLRGIFGRGKG